MANGCISIERILNKLDEYLHKNDYQMAENHLLYWLDECISLSDRRTELFIRNELMGLYRKMGSKQSALSFAYSALSAVKEMGIQNYVGAATTYLNSATVFKAFGIVEEAIPLFEKTKRIYEMELPANDTRLGGLYNNMALALVDVNRFGEAYELYEKAISIMELSENGALESAITYLNIASAKEAELGLEEADEQIRPLLEKAKELIEKTQKRDGYYAFVCEKCAPVFGYYGYFAYEGELLERARRIYEGN